MNVHKLWTDDRAVSPVVGVALLIAITVILAAVIGGVVLGLGTGGVDTPQAQLTAELDPDNNDAVIHHNGGEPIPADHIVVRVEGHGDITLSEDLTAGGSVDLFDATAVDNELTGLNDGDTITILWEDPNSNSTTVLERFEA